MKTVDLPAKEKDAIYTPIVLRSLLARVTIP